MLELLSPSNKLESVDHDRYLRKRRNFVSGGIKFVAIDLVRHAPRYLRYRPARPYHTNRQLSLKARSSRRHGLSAGRETR